MVTLSGPSHAEEVIRGHPTTLVAASSDVQTAEIIQNFCTCNTTAVSERAVVDGIDGRTLVINEAKLKRIETP